jgi:hypothetical protein
MAPGAPGEQGVNLFLGPSGVSTVVWRLACSGFVTSSYLGMWEEMIEGTYLFEVGSREDFSDRLHECISDDDGNITSRVSTISSSPS